MAHAKDTLQPPIMLETPFVPCLQLRESYFALGKREFIIISRYIEIFLSVGVGHYLGM